MTREDVLRKALDRAQNDLCAIQLAVDGWGTPLVPDAVSRISAAFREADALPSDANRLAQIVALADEPIEGCSCPTCMIARIARGGERVNLLPRVIRRAYCPHCKQVTLAVGDHCHWCDAKLAKQPK